MSNDNQPRDNPMAPHLKKLAYFILFPAMLGGVVYLGFFLAQQLSETFDMGAWNIGVAVFGGGVVLSTVNGLAKSLPSIFDFIEKPSFKTLSIPVVALFIASFSLFASYFVYENQKKPSRSEAPNLVMLNFSSPEPPGTGDKPTVFMNFTRPTPAFITDNEALITFYVTFGEDATAKALNNRTGEGMSIHPADRKLLRNLIEDLAACGRDSSESVEIEVLGFSSSSDWEGAARGESNQKNLLLANTRAQLVADFINTNVRGEWLEISAPEWKTIDAMIANRKFNDRFVERYSERMGRLNRRVEIRILSLADCQR